MKKKADWKQDFKKFLQDNRQAIGVGLAGLGGGLIGGGILPGLIYKKPTWGSRFLLGGGTGILTALGVLAALSKSNAPGPRGLNATRDAVAAIKSLPDALTGGTPTVKQIQNMGPVQRALYGIRGQGALSWAVRQLRRALPSGRGLRFGKLQEDQQRQKAGQSFKTTPYHIGESVGAYGGLALGGATWIGLHKKLQRMAQNFNRATQIGDLIGKANIDNSLSGLSDPAVKSHLDLLQQKAGRSSFKSFLQLLKARTTLFRNKNWLPKFIRPKTADVNSAITELFYNPFSQHAALGKGGKVLNPLYEDLARKLKAAPNSDKLSDLAEALGRNKKDFVMPKVTGWRRLGRGARYLAPAIPALIVSGLTNQLAGANDNLNNMTAQKIYKDL